MPTPFTHLASAARLLEDRRIAASLRARLHAQLPAFLLGQIAADARVRSALKREHTHFYRYEQPVPDHPWRLMLRQYPALCRPADEAQRIFLAGYIAHLSLDELWALRLLPHFFHGDWGADRHERIYWLHILLTLLDARDYRSLAAGLEPALARAQPAGWLPFLDDEALGAWRDLICRQLRESSETLAILSRRVGATAAEFRARLTTPRALQEGLWAHLPPARLAQLEEDMYAWSRGEMLRWFAEQAEAQSSSTARTRN